MENVRNSMVFLNIPTVQEISFYLFIVVCTQKAVWHGARTASGLLAVVAAFEKG
jgi:hypothetical protein